MNKLCEASERIDCLAAQICLLVSDIKDKVFVVAFTIVSCILQKKQKLKKGTQFNTQTSITGDTVAPVIQLSDAFILFLSLAVQHKQEFYYCSMSATQICVNARAKAAVSRSPASVFIPCSVLAFLHYVRTNLHMHNNAN